MDIIAAIGWPILPRIPVGPLEISPHGIGIAVGYFLGASLFARRAERLYGVEREHVWNMLLWAIVGVIVGSRLVYVIGHFDDYAADPVAIFRVWEGGIVLYGGIFGGIAAAYPYARKHALPFRDLLDAAAPAFPLGIIFGRTGDLIIGDHLGGPTDFFLGYRYGGSVIDRGPPGCPADPATGFLNTANNVYCPAVGDVVHQTALYDLIIVAILFPVVLAASRRRRPAGWLIVFTATLYAAGRFVTDFARTTQEYAGLHGTQWVSLALISFGIAAMSRWSRRAAEPQKETASIGEHDHIARGDDARDHDATDTDVPRTDRPAE